MLYMRFFSTDLRPNKLRLNINYLHMKVAYLHLNADLEMWLFWGSSEA